MFTETEQKVYDILDLLEIKYDRHEHDAVYTIEEANNLGIHIEGQLCKNLFLRNRKGDIHYLVVLDETKQVDLKSLAKQIGSSSLSFASVERLFKYLGLKPGSVSPFGIINDTESEVVVLIDRDITNAEIVSFYPNINTVTIGVSYLDFEKFIKWKKNQILYVDID
ncbi:prolyl-tRNA synthetase associated domain-containing protein [Clostridium folliculivorans]|uniref:Aminoacyl-tRNA deacylase n=1 Tax=Clostridium folliculivorans TaxID=2886038 RepID=A0A9W6DAS5_9CLOT|nr:prolyl-tRNA synthetase associated domain-containing protein [Clostridium folliculivorans]GKU24978.1 aminoacyl-tRNA deacylase [Clostridium folliculivorans]GKU31076.1 aminoacyl-tRNA deacylase [Clostridium folliculivorans]